MGEGSGTGHNLFEGEVVGFYTLGVLLAVGLARRCLA